MRVVSTRCIAVPVAHSGVGKILDVALVCISSRAGMLSRFFVRFVLLFRVLMLTSVQTERSLLIGVEETGRRSRRERGILMCSELKGNV